METCKDSVAIEDMVMELVELSVRPVSESVITGIKKDFPTFAVKVSEFLNLFHADAQWGKNALPEEGHHLGTSRAFLRQPWWRCNCTISDYR